MGGAAEQKAAERLVDRGPLIERLLSGHFGRLTLVEAPLGYGKTTLLKQLRRAFDAQGALTIWHSLDDYLPSPDRFLSDLAMSLHENHLALDISDDAIGSRLAGAQPRSLINLIIAALAASPRPVVLFIDDYHQLGASAVDQMLSVLLQRMPNHCALVMATRERPNLQFYLFRSRGVITTVTKQDLQFSRQEAQAYFGPGFDVGTVDLIVERTEGWPAALQLTKLYMEEGRTAPAFLTERDAPLPDVADYLAEQIFERLDEPLKVFLMHSSILDRMSGDLINAVCEIEDGWARLEQLAAGNLLTFALDVAREWFRYHTLFSSFLRRRLRRLPGAATLIPRLHERAARWFAVNGHLHEALHHAAVANDRTLGLELLEQAGGWRLALAGGIGCLHYFRDWRAEPPVRYPRVHLGRVYMLAQNGQMSDARRELQVVLTDCAVTADSRVEAEMLELILRVYEDAEIKPATARALEERLFQVSSDAVLRGLAKNLFLVSCYDDRDYSTCQSYGEQALANAHIHHSPYADGYIYIYVALASLFKGEFDRAAEVLQRANAHAIKHFGRPSNLEAICSVLLGALQCLAGHQDAARALLFPALQVAEDVDGWFEVYALGYVTAARLERLRGAHDSALALLHQGQRTAAKRNLRRLYDFLRVQTAKTLLASGDLPAARRLWQQELRSLAPLYATGNRDVWLRHELAICQARLDHLEGGPPRAVPALQALALAHQATGQRYFAMEAEVLCACLMAAASPLAALGRIDAAAAETPAAILETLIADEGYLAAPLLRLGRAGGGVVAVARGQNTATTDDSPLTSRELDVLRGLADGCSSKEMARRLGIAESTVKTHRLNVYRKLGAATRSAVIANARRIGLLDARLVDVQN